MAAVWAVLGVACLWANLQPATWIVVAFALANAYFAVIGAYLQATRPAT
jgi:hypothetical protein